MERGDLNCETFIATARAQDDPVLVILREFFAVNKASRTNAGEPAFHLGL